MVAPSPGNPPTTLSPSVVAAEQRTREFLAQAKWRKARDEVKPLVKLDRDRYLPLLIQANLGLVRELMAKGLVADAQSVLAYLATIAPTDQLRAVELEMAGKDGNPAELFPRYLAALADASLSLPPDEKLRLADQSILAFQGVPADADPACGRLAAEVGAVHDALLAISMQQWDRAVTTLRAIPLRSVFSHWATFLKGVMAFHNGDGERATRCFAGLPADSVPAQASQAYRLLAGQLAPAPNGPPIPELALDGAGRLAGQPSVGRALFRAERLWKVGRFTESYCALRDGVAQFPTAGCDWLGALSEFYFRAARGMAETASYNYLDFFASGAGRKASKNSVEELLTLRLLALSNSGFGNPWELRSDWERYLSLLDRLRGPNPRRASIGYGWLGEQLAQPPSEVGWFGPRSDLRDAGAAIECLRKAIALDPNNLPAHLKLVSIYGTLARIAERNRLLDEMCKRFPEEKAVLLEAARRCLERKVFVKGLDFLERARQLDRIDPVIPELIVSARRQLARQYFQQQRTDQARQTLADTEEFLTDLADDFHRGRWIARLHHGLLEELHGDVPAGEVQLAEARARSPFPAAFVFAAHLTYRAYAPGKPGASPFLPELQKELKNAPSAARAVQLRRLLQFWIQAPEKLELRSEEKWLRGYVRTAAKAPFTREEARQLIELPDNQLVYESAHENALLLFVKKVLRDDAQDPRFRLFDHTLRPPHGEAPEQIRAKLESILAEATRRRDDPTTQKVRQLLKRVDHLPPPPFPPLGPDDDAFDDFVDGPPDLEKLFPSGVPQTLEEVQRLFEMLRAAEKAGLLPPGGPFPEGGPDFLPRPSNPAPRKKLSPPPAPPPPPDPNQFNLL